VLESANVLEDLEDVLSEVPESRTSVAQRKVPERVEESLTNEAQSVVQSVVLRKVLERVEEK